MTPETQPLTRRDFLGTAAVAGAGLALPRATGAAVPGDPPRPRPAGRQSVFGLATTPLDRVRLGFIGLGGRGMALLGNLLDLDGVEIKAVCDLVPERVKASQQRVVARGQPVPAGYGKTETEFEALCRRDDVDLVYIATPWDWHVPMAVSAMKAGKHAAVEVPAALTFAECWQLVDTAEETRRHCVMLENCCYGETELLILSMVRQGLFGELTHGEAGYLHDLRDYLLTGSTATNWRRRFAAQWNGNLYPTHGLGPVAQYLGIHGGDKFDYLVSMSAPELALSQRRDALPAADPRRQERYACGDLNTSLLKTARGRTVMVQYSLTMPRPYSRLNRIAGTAGTFCDYPPRLHLDGQPEGWETDLAPYHAKYGHPLWKRLGAEARRSGGHGGMDYVMNRRLIECLRQGWPLDLTVYDAAAWSSIVPASLASVAQGSAPVAIPDFTRGDYRAQPPLGIVGG